MNIALSLIAGLTLLAASALAAEPRTALVMGVWDYTDANFPALPGIEDDVKNMSAKLGELGFEVTTVKNPTLGQAKEAVDAFSATLKTRKGVGCFYFSGHGTEHEGKNYLIPKGTHIARRADVDDEALSAQRVLNGMEDAGTKVNLVFLDCCRNGLTKGSSGGLAAMQASGSFIGFATASAKEANAAQGGSIYTQALLKHLATPGISITDMHTLVTREVKQITTEAGSPQVPFQYSGLDDVFFLVPSGTRIQPVVARTTPETIPPQPMPQTPRESPAPETPDDLPSKGFFDLDAVFSGTPYAGFNRYSKSIVLQKAQQKLKNAGLYNGSIDGAMGKGSEQALLQWQRQQGQAVNGRMDKATIASLGLENITESRPPSQDQTATNVIQPKPTGAGEHVSVLPVGAMIATLHGERCWRVNNVYYRRDPSGQGYIIFGPNNTPKKMAATSNPQASAEERFKALDKNDDGYLSFNEFAAGQSDKARAMNIFKSLDTNGDGWLSLQEYLRK